MSDFEEENNKSIDLNDTSEASARPKIAEIHSAGGVVFDQAGKILFCHPTNSHSANWRMPKGRAEKEESLRVAALREVKEETGYRCKIFAKIRSITRYRSNSDGTPVWKTLHLFAMTVEKKVQEPDWENDRFEWLAPADAALRAATREWPLIDEAIQHWNARQQRLQQS